MAPSSSKRIYLYSVNKFIPELQSAHSDDDDDDDDGDFVGVEASAPSINPAAIFCFQKAAPDQWLSQVKDWGGPIDPDTRTWYEDTIMLDLDAPAPSSKTPDVNVLESQNDVLNYCTLKRSALQWSSKVYAAGPDCILLFTLSLIVGFLIFW